MLNFRINIFLFFSLFLSVLSAQVEPVSGLTYLDKGEYDRVLRSYAGQDSLKIPSSYFVITANTSVSSHTLAPAIIKSYRQIRTFDPTVPIYIIYRSDGAVNKKNQEKVFNKIYNIDLNDTGDHVIAIGSNDLFNLMNYGNDMVKWFYVYKRRLLVRNLIKLHDLSSYQYRFPKDIVRIETIQKIAIRNDSILLSPLMDVMRPYKDEKFLYITDIENNLHVLNSKTGEFEISYDKGIKSGVDIYCEIIAKDSSNCAYARKRASTLKSLSRDENFFVNASYLDDKIYVASGLQIYVPLKDTPYKNGKLVYINEEGKKEVYKGDFAFAYSVLIEIDTSLNYQDSYFVNDFGSYPKKNRIPKDGAYFAGVDMGIYIEDTILTVYNAVSFNRRHKRLPKKCRMAYSYYELYKKERIINFKSFLPIEHPDAYINHPDLEVFVYYIPIREHLFAVPQFEGKIFELKKDYKVFDILGGRERVEENVPLSLETPLDQLIFNFNIQDANSIFNNKFIAVLYYNVDAPFLEIIEVGDKRLKTVEIINLGELPGFSGMNKLSPGGTVTICNDAIYMVVSEDEEIYLYKYPLSLRMN